MINKADFAHNAAKHQTRLDNLRAAQQSYVLWSPHKKKLVDDWVELPGEGFLTAAVVGPHLSSQAQFVVVDEKENRLRRCREEHRGKKATWVHGDLLDLVVGRHPCLDNAGVVNFDPFLSLGAPLEEALEILGDFSRQRQQEASHFLLVVNVTAAIRASLTDTLRWMEKILPQHLGEGHMPGDLSTCVYTSRRRPMVNVQIGFGFDPHHATKISP